MKRRSDVNQEKSKNPALESFSTQAYLSVNKRILKKFGPEGAIFLANLIDNYLYYLHSHAIKGEWFYVTHQKQMTQTGIQSEYRIRKWKKYFQKLEILELRFMGQPGKEYYKINEKVLWKILGFSSKEIEGLALKKSEGSISINTNKIKTKNKKMSFIDFQDFLEKFPKEWQKNEDFQEALESFILHRKEINRKLTDRAANGIVNKAVKTDIVRTILSIWRSIESGWTSIFPDKEELPESLEEPIGARIARWYSLGRKKPPAALLRRFARSNKPHEHEIVKRWERTPSSSLLVTRYAEWLEKQNWISDKEAWKLYEPDGKVFKRFLSSYQREIGVNIITGEEV